MALAVPNQGAGTAPDTSSVAGPASISIAWALAWCWLPGVYQPPSLTQTCSLKIINQGPHRPRGLWLGPGRRWQEVPVALRRREWGPVVLLLLQLHFCCSACVALTTARSKLLCCCGIICLYLAVVVELQIEPGLVSYAAGAACCGCHACMLASHTAPADAAAAATCLPRRRAARHGGRGARTDPHAGA